MSEMADLFAAERRQRRFPFDRIGVIALVWAGAFAVAATGLSFLLY
jgi:hypothetical protein